MSNEAKYTSGYTDRYEFASKTATDMVSKGAKENDVQNFLSSVNGLSKFEYTNIMQSAFPTQKPATTGGDTGGNGTVTPATTGGDTGGGNGTVTPTAPTTPTTPAVNQFYDVMGQWFLKAQQQQKQASDYAVQQGVAELQRAEEDAKEQFQAQRNQVDADEAKAKDNQALYAESRGDKGGIGAEQYNSIMNTAARNRLLVNQAQTKLATDTARQIADLRAKGEFEKADALLELTQTYLSQLVSMEQWAYGYQLSVDQFNQQVEEWKKNVAFKTAELTGIYDGALTMEGKSYVYSLLGQGIMPDDRYLTAAGLTKEDAYLEMLQMNQGGYPLEETCIKTAKDMLKNEGAGAAMRYLRDRALDGTIDPAQLYQYIVSNIGSVPTTYEGVRNAITVTGADGSTMSPVTQEVFEKSNLTDQYADYSSYLLDFYITYAE